MTGAMDTAQELQDAGVLSRPAAADDIPGMSTQAQASQTYLRNAVMTASAEQLHLMLIDGAIRFTLKAKDALAQKQYEASFNNLERAQRIVLEMANGLNRDVNPGVVDQMLSLYNFTYQRMVDASMERNPEILDESVRILRHQRETWQLIIEKIRTEAPQQDPETPSKFTAEG